ncbi:uncharacterized protein F5147DRAFT_650970 [Suillus discolor]|uniref:Uncharacterized protein n=1 Tax=Suillus discolor TaxID=1912936 RepID=A0A9P7FD72_9AGAM|nr:uncharacterized protein F5147DRAFT_650970 [Suillus discolor]KAG2112338.1 hypothetical protein F5147DRAFT_650970 [Suillus discolor]
MQNWRLVKGKERSLILTAIHKEAVLQAPSRNKAILKDRKKIYKKLAEATKTVIHGLSPEQMELVKALAEKWNNEVAPLDVQANVAKSKGADMIEHFTTEMFKQTGMRVFVLSAWCDTRGKHDFNHQFASGERFTRTTNIDEIFMPEWKLCAANQFGMCIGTESGKATVPWGDVVKNQSDFFESTYWPANIQLVEPSKMGKGDVTTLLDFWYDRQQKHIRLTFSFKAWKDSDGDMETLSKTFKEAFRCATKKSNCNSIVSTRTSAQLREQDEDSTDEEVLEDEEHGSAADKDTLLLNSGNKVPPLAPPIIQHATARRVMAVAASTTSTQSPMSNMVTGKVAAPLKHSKAPATANVKSKEHVGTRPINDQLVRPHKRHMANPISDTPAK